MTWPGVFRGRPFPAALAAIAVAGASCLAVIACGPTASGPSAAPAASTAVASPVDPLATLTAAQVRAEAIADMYAEPSLTLHGAGIESGEYGTTYVGIVRGKGCTMTVTHGVRGAHGTMTSIVIGQTVYMKPDSVMWQVDFGSYAARITRVVRGRYVKDPLSDPNLTGFYGCSTFWPLPVGITLIKGQVTMLNGIRVLLIMDSHGDVTYVTDTSKPEVVQQDIGRLPGTTQPADHITWSVAPVKLTAPPASQVIDGSQIGL
jgi:hypothetical protein